MDNEDLPVMRQKAKSQEEILDDLKIIEASEIKKQEAATAPPPEDLTQDPFVKPIKPQRSKKPISEKQKEHLARARAKASEMKAAKLNKTQSKIVEKVEKAPEPEDMDEKEFEKWLKNYDKFNDMMTKIKAAEEEKRRKQEAKEKAIEDRLRAKIEKEYLEKLSHSNSKVNHVSQQQRQVAPPPPPDPYSQYFDEY
jgi:hypothetical protein